MLSTLFGKKAREKTTNPPWDTITVGSIEIPVWRNAWRNAGKEDRVRFTFGFSRPYEVNGERHFAKTFGFENLWDIIRGLEEFGLAMRLRKDVSSKDRELLDQVLDVLERALAIRETKAKQGNGRDEPAR